VSNFVGPSAKIIERMVNQNTFDDVTQGTRFVRSFQLLVNVSFCEHLFVCFLPKKCIGRRTAGPKRALAAGYQPTRRYRKTPHFFHRAEDTCTIGHNGSWRRKNVDAVHICTSFLERL